MNRKYTSTVDLCCVCKATCFLTPWCFSPNPVCSCTTAHSPAFLSDRAADPWLLSHCLITFWNSGTHSGLTNDFWTIQIVRVLFILQCLTCCQGQCNYWSTLDTTTCFVLYMVLRQKDFVPVSPLVKTYSTSCSHVAFQPSTNVLNLLITWFLRCHLGGSTLAFKQISYRVHKYTNL